MSLKQRSRKTRDVISKLSEEGWFVARRGTGDHVQYKHPTKPGKVTVDSGASEVPTGTLRSIYRQAGWEW